MKFGKWIGGGIGWAFGGPIGALVGFALGSVFDNFTVVKGQAIQQTQQGDFMLSLLVLTATIMKVDGKVLKSELDFVKKAFLSQFDEDTARQYLSTLRELLKQDIPLHEVSMQIRQNMDKPSKLQLIHYLFGISSADGDLHHSEIKLITQIAADIGVSAADFDSIRGMFIPETDSLYKILEVSPDVSDEELKKAYRRMAVKYHPDKVSHLGPELQKTANEKFQKLNAAYETIKKQRGIA